MQTSSNHLSLLKKTRAGPAAVILAMLFSLILFVAVPPDILDAWTEEDGLFEMGSAAGWFIVSAILLYLSSRRESRPLFLLSAMITSLFGMRELDWHKAFTTDSLLKTNYYLKTAAPLGEKLLAASIVLVIFLLLGYYVFRYGAAFFRQLFAARPAAITFACFILLLVFTKIVDRSVSVLKDDLGIDVTPWLIHLQTAFEEPLEFFLPFIVLLAAYQYVHAQSPITDTAHDRLKADPSIKGMARIIPKNPPDPRRASEAALESAEFD